jgi:hypothetical protein
MPVLSKYKAGKYPREGKDEEEEGRAGAFAETEGSDQE